MDDPVRLLLTNAGAAGLIALLAWIASFTVRRQGVVHGLWLLALVKLLTPPIAPLPLVPAWPDIALAYAPPAPTVVAIPTPAGAWAADDARASLRTVATAGRRATFPPAGDLEPAAPRRLTLAAAPALAMASALPRSPAGPRFGWRATVWLSLAAGALAISLLTAWRFARFGRLLACARPAPEEIAERAARLATRLGLRRAPPVLLVPARIPPMLWPHRGGPRLLLPARLLPDLQGEELDALLAHELAHVRRRDHWVRLVEIAATALFWWYPVTWWARRALRRAEERCCDEWVLRLLPRSAQAYANGLLKSLTFVAETPVPAAASGLGPVDDLEARLKEILMTRPVPQLAVPLRLALAMAAALGLAVFPTHAQSSASKDDPATPATAAARPRAAAPVPRPAIATTPGVASLAPVEPLAPLAALTPRPAPAPMAALAPTPQAQPAPAPAIAAGDARPDPARRALEEQRRAIEEQRRQLHQQELELERRQIDLDAQTEQAELRAEADRLRADGKAEDVVRVEKQVQLNGRRVELQKRQLQLEVERAALEAKVESETRAHEDKVAALEQSGRESEAEDVRREVERAEEARERAEQELETKQQAIEKEMAEADRQMQALAAEDQVRAMRDATEELVRSLADQIESLKQALEDAPGQKVEVDREIQRLQAALDALRSGPSSTPLPRKAPRP